VIRALSGDVRTPRREPALPDDLTPREAEVLRLIAQGLNNREIAERLFVTEATVKTHINNIFGKAGLRDRAQAVVYAIRHPGRRA
jgi:DNA-binding NarL/FixJ family response regulator